MTTTPQWATPERLALLNDIDPMKCTCGSDNCSVIDWWGAAMRIHLGEPGKDLHSWLFRAALLTPRLLASIPEEYRLHLPFYLRRELKAYWKEDDRDARKLQARIERDNINYPDRRGWGRHFDPIRKDAFLEERGQMYIEAVGVSALTFTRIVKVRVPSSPVRLFVDVAQASTRQKRRNARRHGKPLPPTVEDLCKKAVQDYLAHL
ncbi:MAG: hypothetical protein Q8O76_13980 [Chloroflexota bacterium]|nr:hypothetical protein [Chloroflexota bacterium]